jgi:hypothetical protein
MNNLPLTIRYIPEARDYVRASRALAIKSASFLIMAALLILAMLISLVVLLVPSIGNQNVKNISLIMVIVGAFYVIYFFAAIPWQLTRAYKKNEHLQVEREFIFKDEGIHIKVGKKEIDLGLDKLQKVYDAKDAYLMFFKDRQKLYFFIPERAFNEQATEKAFVKYLDNKSISVK